MTGEDEEVAIFTSKDGSERPRVVPRDHIVEIYKMMGCCVMHLRGLAPAF